MKLASFVLSGVPLLLQLFGDQERERDKKEALAEIEGDFGIPRIANYDFIIVGGGTAGCVIASRLASEGFTVLFLEAGGSPPPPAHTPLFAYDVAADPALNYFYKSVPQQNMSLQTGGIVSLDTGRMLGGSGSHNEMIHARGSPKDWDSYAELLSDPEWNYENMVEHFKKSENFVGELLQPDQADYYGTGGPLTLDTHISPIFPLWAEAGTELGYPVGDPNGYQIPSFTTFQKLIKSGGRVSTYTGYILESSHNASNPKIHRYSTARKILFSNTTAYGVAYERHGIPQIAHATNEIILSAGAKNSPLLLQLSGIGGRDVLEEAGIPLVAEVPGVGMNLNDHIWLDLPAFRFDPLLAAPFIPRVREGDFEQALADYLEKGEGPFGRIQEGAQAYFASLREEDRLWADGRIYIDSTCPLIRMDDSEEVQACFGLDLDRARSKGTVTLNSTAYLQGERDFVKLALIDFNGFSDDSDMDVLLEGIDLIFKVAENTTAFQSIGTFWTGEPLPACVSHAFRSEAYWRCYIRQRATTAIHMTGTCSMAPASDPFGVTDSQMRVRGVNNLRVVDASVLPYTPNSNLNAAVVALAEKGVQDILREWKH